MSSTGSIQKTTGERTATAGNQPTLVSTRFVMDRYRVAEATKVLDRMKLSAQDSAR